MKIIQSSRAIKSEKKTLLYFWYVVTIVFFLIACQYADVQNVVVPSLVIITSIFHLYMAKKTPPFFIIFLLLLYFNYSVVVGEYSGFSWVGVPDIFDKPKHLYDKMIILVLIFNLGFGSLSFRSGKSYRANESPLIESQPAIAWFSVALLVFILIFGLDRSQSAGYSVKISPLYEYSALVILMGVAFSRQKNLARIVIYILSLMIIIEDLRHGGRMTSVRIFLTLYLAYGVRSISNKKTTVYFVAGVFLMAFIGLSRGSIFNGFEELVKGVAANLFVFDTVVFSYYASITHLMLLEVVGFDFVAQSLISLFGYIFLVDFFSNNLYSLSSVAASRGFISVGGGIAPSFFYFWFGYAGVFLSGFLIASVYNFFSVKSGGMGRIIFIAIVALFPRWYLYSPWVLPKTIILFFIVYLIFKFMKKEFSSGSWTEAKKVEMRD